MKSIILDDVDIWSAFEGQSATRITLSAEDTALFFSILEDPVPMNQKLKTLIQNYRESDLYLG